MRGRKESVGCFFEPGPMEHEEGALVRVVIGGVATGWCPQSAVHPVFTLLGDIDELVSFLGVARSVMGDNAGKEVVARIQNDLFLVQAEVGEPVGAPRTPARIGAENVVRLAEIVARYESMLPPLTHFVVPGGAPSATVLHVARAVARRTERAFLRYGRRHKLNLYIPPYLDRVACVLFSLARWENRLSPFADVPPEYGERMRPA